MKKVNLVVMIGIMLFAFNSFSQTANSDMAKVTFSEKYEKPKASDVREVFALDNGNFVTVREYGEFLSFSLFNSEMKLLKGPEKIKFTHNQEEVGKNYFHSTILVDNKVVIFARQKDKKAKQFNVIAQIFDVESFAISLKPNILFSIPFSKARWENFDVTVSKNKKYFILDYFVKSSDKRKKYIALRVYNAEAELQWAETTNITTSSPNLTKSIDVSAEGLSVLSLIIKENPKDKKEIGAPTVVVFDKEGAVLKEVKLEKLHKEKIYISTLQVEFGKDGVLYAIGLYLNQHKRGPIGTVTFSYNVQNDEVSDVVLQTIPDKAVVEYQGERRAKKHYEHKKDKGSNALRGYRIDNFITHNNGYYLLLEKYSSYYYDKTRTTTYTFGHILVVNFDKEHNIVWAKKIPKNQIVKQKESLLTMLIPQNTFWFTGYSAFTVNDALYLVYNDNIKNFKNLKAVNEGKMKSMTHNGYGGGTAITLAKLNSEGKLKIEPVYTVDDNDALLTRPNLGVIVQNEAIILFARRSKDFRFVKIQPK